MPALRLGLSLSLNRSCKPVIDIGPNSFRLHSNLKITKVEDSIFSKVGFDKIDVDDRYGRLAIVLEIDTTEFGNRGIIDRCFSRGL